jgi:Fe-S-cluster containining protein
MPQLVDFQDYEFVGLPRTENNLRWCREHFQCQECGQCCRLHTAGIKIYLPDAKRLARHDKMKLKEFFQTVEKCQDHFLMAQPCRYLKGNRCTVHAINPEICRNYPLQCRVVDGQDAKWLVIVACPGGKKLIELLLTGRQAGLEYLTY